MEITQEKLKEILHYDPETGVFRWRKSVANIIKPLDVAGSCLLGYIKITIKRKSHNAHRLAWLYVTGCWPKNQIDHINGIGNDNKFSNLREATHKQNSENRCLPSTNTSGFRGVSWDKDSNKWRAYVKHNGKMKHLGRFQTAEEAAKVAAAKRAELFTHDHGRDQVNTGV
jgi:hypothetical protein